MDIFLETTILINFGHLPINFFEIKSSNILKKEKSSKKIISKDRTNDVSTDELWDSNCFSLICLPSQSILKPVQGFMVYSLLSKSETKELRRI